MTGYAADAAATMTATIAMVGFVVIGFATLLRLGRVDRRGRGFSSPSVLSSEPLGT